MLPPPAPGVKAQPPSPPAPPDRSRRWTMVAAVGAAALVTGIAGVLIGVAVGNSDPNSRPVQVAAEGGSSAGLLPVRDVVDAVGPSIVTISSDVQLGRAVGTAVIVSADGELLTNAHVVDGATTIHVRLAGETEPIEATVVASDVGNDLALLRIDRAGLTPVTFAPTSEVALGDEVLAIGFALDLDGDPTVTLGIVSAVSRNNLGISQYEDFVQTDAAINPGNSGGALVNARGELVGINTVIFSQSGGYQGIGFAVSSNLAKRVFNDLRQYREVRRGWMGAVRFAPLTTQLAQRLGAPDTKGAVVWQMDQRAAAYRAGIEPGDVVVAFNGTEVADPGHLERLMSDAPIGSTATVTIIRDGRRTEVRVPIQRRTA